MKFSDLNNQALITSLTNLVSSERRITADLVECLKEIDRRRLFLELGYSSLFSYLTDGLGYPPASAQRRIEAARLAKELPQVAEDLKSGEINLSQISLISKAIREKQKQSPELKINHQDKQNLFNSVKGHDIHQTEVLLAQTLDLEIVQSEKTKIQADESVRVTLTFSKEQKQNLERAKEILSAKYPSLNYMDLINILTTEFLKRKDLSLEKSTSDRKSQVVKKVSLHNSFEVIETQLNSQKNSLESAQYKADTHLLTKTHLISEPKSSSLTCPKREAISMPLKRQIFKRDQCCQYKDKLTAKKCASRFQLQIDHIQPVWAGGSNEESNLQLLCAQHNRLKYRKETHVGLVNRIVM